MTTKIAASVVVTRGSGADNFAITELDDVLNGDRTTFKPDGDTIYFLVQHDPVMEISYVRTTLGQVNSQGEVSRVREDELFWPTLTEELELSYIPAGGLNALWFGNAGTGLRKFSLKSVELGGGTFPAIGRISYPAVFKLFRWIVPAVTLPINPDGTSGDFPVRAFIHLEKRS